MRDVVDLTPAIEAAARALMSQTDGEIGDLDEVRVYARAAVEAAAPVLGITDLNAIPDTRVRPPLPQSGGPAQTTETIKTRYT